MLAVSRIDKPSGTAIPVSPDWCREAEAARQRRGMSLEELARLVGTTHATVSRLLSGRIPSSKFAVAIARVLRIAEPGAPTDKNLAKWLRIGQRLQDANPTRFAEMSIKLDALADLEESLSETDRDDE